MQEITVTEKMEQNPELGNANDAQRRAITTSEGPLLIIAGPGTGKTYTLVQRIVFLLEHKNIEPEQIFVSTFTEKAAKELVTRISNEIETRGLKVNVNEMYVGTFHSLALRIIKENLDYTRLKTGFRVLDAFDQAYMVYQNFHFFNIIDGLEKVLPQNSKWAKVDKICNWVSNLMEETIESSSLVSADAEEANILGQVLQTYQRLLEDNNLLDFASIQVEALRMLNECPEVRKKYNEQLQYLMVDEYQDTNYIQERLIFALSGSHHNICVVGDDDQGLYRFRGATVRNILEFPQHFDEDECLVIHLSENYRSTPEIVDFYNSWMDTTSGPRFSFNWGNYRYDKKIVAAGKNNPASPTVLKVSGKDSAEDWHNEVLQFIKSLKESGKLTDYNQIAFLFSSVKNSKVKALADFLEANGINIYSPRSDMFFERDEVQLALGCLLYVFPQYIGSFENDAYHWLPEGYQEFIIGCLTKTNEFLAIPENNELRGWVQEHGINHVNLKKPTDYAFSGLFYQLLSFEPFRTIVSTPMDKGVADLRPLRNLALLSRLIGKFEYLHNVVVLSPKKSNGKAQIDLTTERFFNTYLRLLFTEGIGEYEDDSEYAPSGCVSFLTIHQSKGMEFPIVVVDSLWSRPRKQEDKLMLRVTKDFQKRPPFEPREDIKYFDFWRLYYTAFSRAQDLLVLTVNEERSAPSNYFRKVYEPLPDWKSTNVDFSQLDFETIKDVNLKQSFSFTSDVTVYETCSIQYKFFNDLSFQPVRVNAMLFGRLVHQTIEDVHKAALRGEEHLITRDNIGKWLEANYTYLSKAERVYLNPAARKLALEQVVRYAEKQGSDWGQIKDAEVDVSLVKPDYILEGKIDLVRGKDGTVEIVDFKTTKKPDMFSDSELLKRYRRQLHVYAHLVEERTGEQVSKMHLYYTAEEEGSPLVTWKYTKTAIAGTVQAFDDVVHRILSKDYSTPAESMKTCKECDFNKYCAKSTFAPKENNK